MISQLFLDICSQFNTPYANNCRLVCAKTEQFVPFCYIPDIIIKSHLHHI